MSVERSLPPKRDKVGQKTETQIVRDNLFARFSADNAICINLGADLEVAFLAISPEIAAQVQAENGAAIQIKSSFVETARLRCNRAGAVTIAMSILHTLVSQDIVDKGGLKSQIEEMIGDIEPNESQNDVVH
jgi:hypothetical protein